MASHSNCCTPESSASICNGDDAYNTSVGGLSGRQTRIAPFPKTNGKRVRSPTPQPGPLSPKQKKRILSAASTLVSESDRFSETSSDEGPEGKEKKKDLRYAVPESSPKHTLAQGTHPSGCLNEGGKSENPLPGSDPTSSSDQESLSLPKFKERAEMVSPGTANGYKGAVLFFVYHDWIELQDVTAWEHAREALGEALVINSKLPNGFQWLCAGSTPGSSGEPPTEDEIVTFLNGWQSTFQPQTEARDYEERDEPLQPDESLANLDERVNRNRRDALDREFNNQSGSTHINWAEKGKLKADAIDVWWQPTSAPQAATHAAATIPVQTPLQMEGDQEPVHSFGTPGMPIPMCQYLDFFNASIAIGRQAPLQIHQSCDSYANTAAHSIGYQTNLGCSYNPQDTSMGFVPINGA
ncbi:hypothetical protein ACEPAF_1797 [Sanghuangporus sanghuang]